MPLPIAAWQPSLWSDQNPIVDQSFALLERTELDRDSWADHDPGWVRGSDQAFEELLRDIVWSQRRRWMYDRQFEEPRLTSWQKFDERGVIGQSGGECPFLPVGVLWGAVRLSGNEPLPGRHRQRGLAPRPHTH